MAKSRNRSFLWAFGAFVLAKFKWVIAFLKWTKFGGTFLTMAASLWVYALVYGWEFAAALIYLIFVHEMGHVIAARRKGIKTSPAIFIPFVGALISMKEQPRDAAAEAYLAYGGPLAGLVSFLPAVGLYYAAGNAFWPLVVFMGAMLNLFNLIPVSPLDGGRIVSVLSTKIWLAGLAGLGVLLFFSPGPITFLIFLFGLLTWWRRAREGYRRRILVYEKEKLTALIDAMHKWPYLTGTAELEATLATVTGGSTGNVGAGNTVIPEESPRKRKWNIPFLHDEERFAHDRTLIDRKYTAHARQLLEQYKYQPVEYEDNDPARPLPSKLLANAVGEAEEAGRMLNEEFHRLLTYYEASASVRWKVLAAYLALAAVLSLFALYGYRLMELNDIQL